MRRLDLLDLAEGQVDRSLPSHELHQCLQLKALVEFMGRETPVDLTFRQIQKV